MNNITIKRIEKLKRAGFFPDTMFSCLYILQCLNDPFEGIRLLDALDDRTKSKRMILLYYDLMRRGLIKDSETDSHYEITELGRQFLLDYESNEIDPSGEVTSWVRDWIELWPKGVTTGGKLVRSDAKSCLIKLKKFVKDYKYPKDLIFQATKKYVESFESTQYAYMKAATYFIDKRGEGSELASWCEKELNTESDKEEYSTLSNGII